MREGVERAIEQFGEAICDADSLYACTEGVAGDINALIASELYRTRTRIPAVYERLQYGEDYNDHVTAVIRAVHHERRHAAHAPSAPLPGSLAYMQAEVRKELAELANDIRKHASKYVEFRKGALTKSHPHNAELFRCWRRLHIELWERAKDCGLYTSVQCSRYVTDFANLLEKGSA